MSTGGAGSVLVVDDEISVRELLARWLESAGLSVTTAASADEALDRIGEAVPAVALCDISMPGHDGLWLADRIRERYPETAVIMATAVQDVGPVIQSLRQGVVDYLTKPFGRERLTKAVQRGFEWHRAACEAREWRGALERETAMRRARLAGVLAALHIDSDESLEATLPLMMLADEDACAHAHRVASLSVRLGGAMGVDGDDLQTLRRAALLHDLGKLVMPEAILLKPAPLTSEEHALIRQHPVIAAELLSAVPYLASAAPIVRDTAGWVAEPRAGGGSPGETARLCARIIAVADAYDAMRHRRVYRDARTAEEALIELDRGKGTHFDPAVVDAFVRLSPSFR